MMILYSTNCPMCNVLKQKLDEKHIGYQLETDIDKMQELGFTAAPMLQVDKKIMSFREALSYINSLSE